MFSEKGYKYVDGKIRLLVETKSKASLNIECFQKRSHRIRSRESKETKTTLIKVQPRNVDLLKAF